jgi:L-lactate dehydrogenase (cytochrome)
MNTQLITYEDYRRAAKKRLPPLLFHYIDGGAFGEITLARNTEDLEAVLLRQRVLADVSEISTSVTLFGQTLAMPVILAPVGLAGMYARRGECLAARAAAAESIPFCLSTSSVCSIEEVSAKSSSPFWFQLYMLKDRKFMLRLLERAKSAGCPTLVFTVDLAVVGTRYRDVRSGFNAPMSRFNLLSRMWEGITHPQWTTDVYLRGRPHHLGNLVEAMGSNSVQADFWDWVRRNWDSSVTWKDIEWIRANWDGPIVLKGILDAEDAREAVRAGVDGIVVSNHGGRQLDGVNSTARILPKIADAVGQDLAVLVDGGVRSGLDVFKMQALGAKACLIGRAWAFAMAANGQSGIRTILQTMKRELEIAMALAGCTDIRRANQDLLDY